MRVIDPADIAENYLQDLKTSVKKLNRELRVIGLIASEDKPSIAYAKTTKRVFNDAGFLYELRQVPRLQLEREIISANNDRRVHGIFVYFPVFANQEDDYLRNLVHYTRDIEAGSLYWTRKLSANDRLATGNDSGKKALIPCTPLAIVKILDDIGEYGSGSLPISGRKVTIFNRSEVIGRPLAVMMSNDGARVYSFDEQGPLLFRDGQPEEIDISRNEAIRSSAIVITGVPNDSFRVTVEEVSPDSVCVNFSSEKNFDAGVPDKVRTFVPRVGPMTVAMCMRNTIRLFKNFHQ